MTKLTENKRKNPERKRNMVHIVGAGPGAEDLITVRGLRLLKQADIIIYAGLWSIQVY